MVPVACKWLTGIKVVPHGKAMGKAMACVPTAKQSIRRNPSRSQHVMLFFRQLDFWCHLKWQSKLQQESGARAALPTRGRQKPVAVALVDPPPAMATDPASHGISPPKFSSFNQTRSRWWLSSPSWAIQSGASPCLPSQTATTRAPPTSRCEPTSDSSAANYWQLLDLRQHRGKPCYPWDKHHYWWVKNWVSSKNGVPQNWWFSN